MAVVLVAEEHLDHQQVIVEVAHRLGHETVVAEDGVAALVAARQQRPDLVIADVDTPDLDGLRLCRALHENPELGTVPVVVVTASPQCDPVDLTRFAAVAAVQKPFDLAQLSAVIAAQLAQAPAVARHSSPALPPGDGEFAHALLDSVDVGLAACDSAGRLVFYNENLGDFFGPDGAGVPVKDWAGRFGLRHHDGRPLQADQLPMMRALSGEVVRQAGMLATDRQGHQHWLTLNARPVHDQHGRIVGAAAAVHDITTGYRSRIYDACKTAVLEALTGGSNAAVARRGAVEAVGIALHWPYVRLWLHDPVTDRLHLDSTYTADGERPLPVPDSFARGEGLAGHCWEQGELVWVPDIHAPGSPVVPQVRAGTCVRAAGAVPVYAGGQVTGVLTFYSDYPQEQEPGLDVLLTGLAGHIGAHLQQHRADGLARHLAAVTDEYVALAGHELRTPLTSITACSELIAQAEDLPAEVRDMIKVVERNGRHLRQLIDQLLELTALDAGHLEVADEPLDLTTVVRAAVDETHPAATDRQITIASRAPEALMVRGDAVRLQQVVAQLLDNAIKFSPAGSTVAVHLVRDGGAAVLTVSDTGAGLPGDRTADLFRRLYRGDNARHTETPGSGLGLALCRTLVERHHGIITLSPGEPHGTVATVRLPLLDRDGPLPAGK